jgi:hypothetical protein
MTLLILGSLAAGIRLNLGSCSPITILDQHDSGRNARGISSKLNASSRAYTNRRLHWNLIREHLDATLRQELICEQ